MKNKKTIFGLFVLGFIGMAAIVIYTLTGVMPTDPLEGSDQLVLVLTRNETVPKGTLQFFNRVDGAWKYSFSFPVTIGKNGVGWGVGLHSERDSEDGDAVKREGDGKSPEGAFPLIEAYGYPPPSMVRIDFPYTQTTESIICCDDADSRHYNKIFDYRKKGLDGNDLPSHEDMLRQDELYKYVVVVGHNAWKPESGAGSCIFLHLWGGPNSYTAGCTAMSEANILRLMSVLEIEENPVFVTLTRKNYLRLKAEWGLPEVSI